ncbi:beta strand repeat-containing protein [Dryocola sp. BD586]|uniref:beta strand repeat-containing protein n=1 Tax=Dryocola sp. BD586 TaxID=3133271 RepID=UPI003F4FAE9A
MKKSRISQHGSLLVALTSAQGLLAAPALAVSDYTITNSQPDVQISTSYDAVYITDQGTVTGTQTHALSVIQGVLVGTLENAGIITSTDYYALNIDGSINNINNLGVIESSGDAADTVHLSATSHIGTLTNSGTISGSAGGFYPGFSGATINNAGVINTLTNTQNATIGGHTAINNTGQIDELNNAGTIRMDNNNSGYYYANAAVLNQGAIGTFNNTGLIDSGSSNTGYSESAVLNQGTITTFINDGTINSNYIALQNQGAIDTFTNNGEISGAIVGVYNNYFTNSNSTVANGNIVNNGLISSNIYAIYSINYNNTNSSVNIVNSGRITGNSYAIYNNAYGNSLTTTMTIANSGIIEGNILNNSSSPLIIEGGNGSTGILTGINGVGQIETPNSDVIFSTGRLLLDDNILTNGIANNDAASLQINHTIEITGNYHQGSNAELIVGVADGAIAEGRF